MLHLNFAISFVVFFIIYGLTSRYVDKLFTQSLNHESHLDLLDLTWDRR